MPARIGRLCAAQDRLLAAGATGLLGPEPADRHTRVMVTLPSEAARDSALIGDLVDRGIAFDNLASALLQEVGDKRHLGKARTRPGHLVRGTRDIGQKHDPMLAGKSDSQQEDAHGDS